MKKPYPIKVNPDLDERVQVIKTESGEHVVEIAGDYIPEPRVRELADWFLRAADFIKEKDKK